MARTSYLRPSWWMRAVGNRIAPRLSHGLVATLAVRGRASGQWRATPVVVLDVDGTQYLVAPFGDTDWSRNLRAARGGQLTRDGQTVGITVTEVPTAERGPLLDAYQREFGRMPKVADSFRRLPDPADHPTFRITAEKA